MPHIVLLGDSIFDNKAYVAGGPDVLAHLSAQLPVDWRATLCAVDGAMVEDVSDQLANLPEDATHLVLSVGGNNALNHIDILGRPVKSVGEVLSLLADIGERFEHAYCGLVRTLKGFHKQIAVCTVYHPPLYDPTTRRLALAALAVFNDAILRVAFMETVPVVDLRLVCTEEADFADDIEPSVEGGAKIAAAVARAVGAQPGAPASHVFGV